MSDYSPEVLKALKPKHEFFIGVDSDGCTFDTMEIKQKECFIPNIVKHWNLQAVSKYTRAAAEFVNLYSKWRGVNRFPALTKTLDLLMEWPDVQKRNVEIPKAQPLRDWIERETKLGNPALEVEVANTGDPVLTQALEWSKAVNVTVADIVQGGVPPFPFVRESLDKARQHADVIVVSATPCEALEREWEENDIAKYVEIIAGQELGNKKEHIALASGGKYQAGKVLMVGDAPGDMKAARGNDALFYPIMPGHEDESWERFHNEALDRFFAGTYAGDYETQLVDEFLASLPETPPWQK